MLRAAVEKVTWRLEYKQPSPGTSQITRGQDMLHACNTDFSRPSDRLQHQRSHQDPRIPHSFNMQGRMKPQLLTKNTHACLCHAIFFIYIYIHICKCMYIYTHAYNFPHDIHISIYMYMRAGSCKLRHHIPRSRKHKFLRGLNFHQRHRCRRLNLTSHIISMVPLAFQVLNTPKPPSPQPQNYNIETELQPLLAPPLAPRSHRLCLGTSIHQGPGLAEHEWLCTHPLYLP